MIRSLLHRAHIPLIRSKRHPPHPDLRVQNRRTLIRGGGGADKSARSSPRPSSSSSKRARGACENSSVVEKSARSDTLSGSPLSPSEESTRASSQCLDGRSICIQRPKEANSYEGRDVVYSSCALSRTKGRPQVFRERTLLCLAKTTLKRNTFLVSQSVVTTSGPNGTRMARVATGDFLVITTTPPDRYRYRLLMRKQRFCKNPN